MESFAIMDAAWNTWTEASKPNTLRGMARLQRPILQPATDRLVLASAGAVDSAPLSVIPLPLPVTTPSPTSASVI